MENMKKINMLVALALFGLASIAGAVQTLTVNPAASVTGASAATADTVVYRDDNADFAAHSVAISGLVSVSSSATSGIVFVLDGAYTTAQIEAKTPSAAGQLVFNSTLGNVCISTGTTVEGYKLAGTASTTCQ